MDAKTLEELLNTIRDNASTAYQNSIPEATQENLADIGGSLVASTSFINEFTTALMNKIAITKIHDRLFTNPLAELKKGKKPLGDTVEEIFVNFAQARGYDATGADLLTRHLPDVKAVYHKMNREDQYPVTISRQMIKKAFISFETLNTFVSGVMDSMFNGANNDEFTIIKEIIKKAVEDGAMKIISIKDPAASQDNAKKFVKTVKKVSRLMTFPSDQYNGYLNVQNTDILPIVTFTPQNEQLIIIDTDTDTEIDVEVLASAFNMNKAEFKSKRIVIDAFSEPNVKACIIDVNFTQIYDDLEEMSSFLNGAGLYETYYLNVWQTVAYSPLVNAVAFAVASDEDEDGSLEEFSITNTLATGITSSNKSIEKLEGQSYTATLTSAVPITVVVTMGGTDVTSTVYTAGTKKIVIASVTGNVVVTATITG